MDLNEAWRNESALGIDLLGAPFTDPADGGDAAVVNPDVGAVPGPARSVDNGPTADYQVEHVDVSPCSFFAF
jgi:hypothetical protein